MTMEKFYESDFFKKLQQNPKPYTIAYLKKWGPIINHHNLNDILEKLMVDYLIKKDIIKMNYDKYSAKRSDFEQMECFEKELHHRLGKRPVKMEFLNIIPDHGIKEQFDKIIENSDFEMFLI